MMEEEKKIPEKEEKNDTVSGDIAENAAQTLPAGREDKREKEKMQKTRAPLSARTKKRLVTVGIATGAILVALACILICVSILNNRPPEFSTVRERFALLIERSQTLNDVVFGEGLPTYKRVTRDIQNHELEFKGEKENLRYFLIEDAEYGTVISYEYQIRRMEGKLNADGVKIYTIYDAETGGILNEYKQGASRFAWRTKTPVEGKTLLLRNENYYYYALPDYQNPDIMYDTIIYTGREDENYDYVRFDSAYKSTDEIQKALAEVYANDYMGPLYEYLFTGAFGGMNDVYQPVYIDYTDEDTSITYLMKANAKTIWKGKALRKLTFDFSTMEMIERESNANNVKVSVQYTEKGKDGVQTMTVSFARENGSWYLNSATY